MEEEDIEIEEEDVFEGDKHPREIVIPGEVLTEDVQNYLPGRGTILNPKINAIISLTIGLKQISKNYVNVIPLRGFYTPRPGDKVLAIVIDKNPVKYKCDIGAKDFAILKPKNMMKKDRRRLRRIVKVGIGDHKKEEEVESYEIGDALIAKVLSADRLNKPELTTIGKYLGKKTGGVIISIEPPKVPRIIGRNGSMIKVLKKLTKCNIFVTQNGRIWIKSEIHADPSAAFAHERLLIDAIYKITTEAHTVGLTDRMQEFIENEKIKRGI
ncbi:MAG: KH domain-containing protein, partial [Promethearchaeota archaeon]